MKLSLKLIMFKLFLHTVGMGILFWVDWRVAIGVWLVISVCAPAK